MIKPIAFCCSVSLFSVAVPSDPIVVDDTLRHIRNGQQREWSEFALQPDAAEYIQKFEAAPNQTEHCLRLIQEDIKQAWQISLNGISLGRLHRDENAIEGYWAIPPNTLQEGENSLTVTTSATTSDDIRLGSAAVYPHSMNQLLTQARVNVTIRDNGTEGLIPCRVTVLQDERLMTVGAVSGDSMAVRPGVIYCNGRASFGLPPGTFTIIAGRGPEYSISTQTVTLEKDDTELVELTIRREVPTDGFVTCDTHVHTLTHSGHGDASVAERMLTLAGEGVELPIATDHNVHVDYEELAAKMGLRSWFTPVIGNEVTTRIGHFNIFPVASADTPIPDYKADSWPKIFDSIFATPDVRAVILNHPRDVHSNYRPFGPEHHLPLTARNLDNWQLRANAMEVINSAAQQTDMMRLVHDWMSLLNAGLKLTPVGSSDSHDVARHFVGQGRTMIRCEDATPGHIDIDDALRNFVAGRVTISCGLMASIRINSEYGPGESVPAADIYQVEVDALGASWIEADEIEVFVNGTSVLLHKIEDSNRRLPGIKDTLRTELQLSKHQDVFVVAVVRGPGVTGLHWPIAKPYQPVSEDWTPRCMAVTGAVSIDADGDGTITAAKAYAQQLCASMEFDSQRIVAALSAFDRAVALHAADILLARDEQSFVTAVLPKARSGAPEVGQAFEDVLEAARESQRARVR